MQRLIFIHPDGRQTTVDASEGASVMHAATRHGLYEIVAECGGNAMCATCHVYVEPDWLDRLPPVGEDEDALLDGVAAERRPESRLSCQIQVKPALDGLRMKLPERQT